MKYVIVIADGAADVPLDDLGGKTPLETARIPYTDELVANGIIGCVRTVPPGMQPGSDVAIMSLLGNDPAACYSGRAPIEAVARGITLGQSEWAFRCNLVTIIDNVMIDHSSDNISSEEAAILIGEVNRRFGSETLAFYSGVSYRNLMTYKGDFDGVTTPPHDILDKEISPYLPQGRGADLLQSMIRESQVFLPDHEVNRNRKKANKHPATSLWFWGEGTPPVFESFKKKYGLSGAIIAAVDLVRGIGILMGWDVIDVPGATGYFDTSYEGKGSHAIDALEDYEVVCVHIEAPDEAGHAGLPHEKIRAIEAIDTHIVGPIVHHLQSGGLPWRMLLMPDHPTPSTIRTHTADPVPFVIGGSDIEPNGRTSFTEQEAAIRGFMVEKGHTLMDFFLSPRPKLL
ncbi:MAG: cofactor-independent phosphoglycerate mutase [Spirochaetales bacterium]|nr:cofactor-independent phosphoglycerate mutase [Spirochaetales bacterium]